MMFVKLVSVVRCMGFDFHRLGSWLSSEWFLWESGEWETQCCESQEKLAWRFRIVCCSAKPSNRVESLPSPWSGLLVPDIRQHFFWDGSLFCRWYQASGILRFFFSFIYSLNESLKNTDTLIGFMTSRGWNVIWSHKGEPFFDDENSSDTSYIVECNLSIQLLSLPRFLQKLMEYVRWATGIIGS